MNLLIKNGRVVDPANNRDEKLDILIENSLIKKIAPNIKNVGTNSICAHIDASRYIVVPGLIDVHVHFRDPGETEKETISSGSQASASGGFTTVICQPNTQPRIDTPQKVKEIINRAAKESIVNLYPSACITKDHRELTDIKAIKDAGAVTITDDGDPVIQDELMEQALRQAKKYSILVSPHCELSPWAVQYCRKLRWLTEFPTNDYTQEPFFIKRDIELAKKTDSKIHISHVSMEESVIEIARAKRDGVQVTCEATPHHLILDSSAEELYGLNVKVNPPLRSSYDIRALRDGLRDGTIDVLASDHAPHLSKSPDSSGRLKKVYPLPIERDDVAGAKNNRVNVPIYRDSHFEDWNKAPFGLVGLETTLGLMLTYLVAPGVITLQDAIAKMTVNPARIFNLPTGELKIGMPADITIIDLAKEWRVDVDKFKSKSRNSPFHNWKLKGKAVATIARGKIVMQNDKIL